MSRAQGRSSRFPGASAFSSSSHPGTSGFGGFSSTQAGSGLSYLTEPLDFSSISDANVGVAFKNLLKKDATTKTKALEELVAYVRAHPHEQHGGPEEAILEAWVQVYPRISIDNARRARELSHTLQFELMKSARKRMEKRVPKVVGTWLAGTTDKDRAVANAASQGLSSLLTNIDKVLAFWKKCQHQILTYSAEAIRETKDTLSDERSTTADDAEAKYFRVVNSSLSLVLELLQKLEQAVLDAEADSYDIFFSEDVVWKSATFADSAVRKVTCELLWTCLEKRHDSVASQVSRLKKIFVTEGLKSNQTGSAVEYVRVLTRLTQKFPEVWSSSSDKKTPISRLQIFLEKGSQGSSVKFWGYLEQLLAVLPTEQLTHESASDILGSLRVGIASRGEPRINAPPAWTCYVRAARHFLTLLPPDGPQSQFLLDHIFPLISHYLKPTTETTGWHVGGKPGTPVLVEAFGITVDRHLEGAQTEIADAWQRLSSELCSKISSSLPEVSKDYEKSQDAVAQEGDRWFLLVGQIHAKIPAAHPKAQVLDGPSKDIVFRAIELLANRNLKPYGAASVLHSVGRHASFIWEDKFVLTAFEKFLLEQGRDHMDLILASRSRKDLVACVSGLGASQNQHAAFSTIWKTWVDTLILQQEKPAALEAIGSLATSQGGITFASSHAGYQDLLAAKASQSLQGSTDAWSFLEEAFSKETVTDRVSESIVQEALTLLGRDKQHTDNAVRALEMIASRNPAQLSRDDTTHMVLITSLLGLAELDDSTISSRANTLRSLIDKPSGGKQAAVAIIRRNLEDANHQSLGIETICDQAIQAAEGGDVAIKDLLPNTTVWMQELRPFLQSDVDPSLAITSNIAGAQFLVQPEDSDEQKRIRRDREGRSIPARMALYTAQLLASQINLQGLLEKSDAKILLLLAVSIQLTSDQITLQDTHKLWASLAYKDSLPSAESLVSTSRTAINELAEKATGWSHGTSAGTTELVNGLVELMATKTRDLTPLGLYNARALNDLIGTLTDHHGPPSAVDDVLVKFDAVKASPTTILGAVALLDGFGEVLQSSKLVNTLCNRLISDAAGLSAQSEKTLPTLVLLNTCTRVFGVGEIPVANNRLVFAIRQITSWLDDPVGLTPALSTEICRALHMLLPSIKDVYGPHWERTIEFCTTLWSKAASDDLEDAIPYIHASLRLMNTLESISEPNDDLVDAIQEAAENKSRALLTLLEMPREKSTQPLEIIDGLICRQVEKIPLKHVADLSDLYGLVSSESRDIQTAAFSVLHRSLPAKQEQLSIDVLLEKSDARLPDELLSLLLEAPTLEKYSDEVLAQFPTAIRSYLLTWCLVFDAYSTASLKVRNDYTEHLKTENYVGPLMEFTFDVLGHSAAHALNLDREGLTIEQIRSYDLKVADSEPEEKNLHWLLVHLYYLTLKYIPGLFRAWYIECRSKQTKIAVEAWMIKYFSPLIISEVLDEVAVWASSQEAPAADENELVVKVSPTAKEITAGYEVDESLASIAIRVPAGYPLEGVNVVGLNRVAVNERKWQSWLMTTQGVITFSNGSIIDGLTTFRRNIVGALKGQSECAICYSIISTDKKMPDKKCSTCKNLFHRTCLYKWFQSSNQNTCPLCRNPIDYLGSDVKTRRAAAA
ncbi:E3 ubiquitin-protein ligase listerin like [Verticillium longisporum]|uniref:E3 ubiquitin-protein ligase listerin n=1 Tax=Verticillium longisporum TaxID=100787 RepID=A0A8I2ZT09_VERLO|nr:E3 ubiquitin-protein ligase listerin like [Verticillium longisporum]